MPKCEFQGCSQEATHIGTHPERQLNCYTCKFHKDEGLCNVRKLTSSDLEFLERLAMATTEQLINALQQRFDAMIFVANKEMVTGKVGQLIIRSSGNAFTNIGLVRLIDNHLQGTLALTLAGHPDYVSQQPEHNDAGYYDAEGRYDTDEQQDKDDE